MDGTANLIRLFPLPAGGAKRPCPWCRGAASVDDPVSATPRGCQTCDEHGVGDLVVVSVVEAGDAIERAFVHLAQWRSGRQSDVTEARDVVDALDHAYAEIAAAATRIRAELAHVQAASAVRTQAERAVPHRRQP
jgi:hypothetical protein